MFTHSPFFISHLITSRCNASCPTCLWKGIVKDELDTSKIINFYRQARNLGFISTVFWGGEPLMRKDTIDILRFCKESGFVCGLITNGYLLPERYKELAQLLDFLIVSIDIPSEKLDELRGVHGLFKNALEGINLIRRSSPNIKIFINTVISRLNYQYLDDVIDFVQASRLTVTFESMTSGREDVDTLKLPNSIERQVFQKLIDRKKEGKPINNSFSYLKMFAKGNRNYTCHTNEIAIRVEPNGNLTNCLSKSNPIGNVYEENLSILLKSISFKVLQRKGRKCSKCVDAGTIESSFFWDLNPEVMISTLHLFLK